MCIFSGPLIVIATGVIYLLSNVSESLDLAEKGYIDETSNYFVNELRTNNTIRFILVLMFVSSIVMTAAASIYCLFFSSASDDDSKKKNSLPSEKKPKKLKAF
mmetsp:Transcript_62228/g.71346  ORF Transcript_62228/g.71346 Transcript_62228/m.71346 type:complete len:103 (+) Transcript_62228:157-465(+)